MSLFQSTPRGMKIIGLRLLIITTLAWCLIPSLIGGLSWQVIENWDTLSPRPSYSQSRMLTWLMFVSPLISGPFWLAVALGTALFSRHGQYGSLVAVLWGAVLGAMGTWLTGAPTLIALGAILATFHRFTLALFRPEAF